jgi:hypothetical protein
MKGVRQAFDKVERTLGAPLEDKANTSGAAYLFMAVGKLTEIGVQQVAAARSRAVHLAALPSQRDIRELAAQVARLQRAVDEIQQQLEEQRES